MERDEFSGNEQFWRWLARRFAMPALLATPARLGMSVVPSRLEQAVLQTFVALLGPSGVQVDETARAAHADDRLAARHGADLPDLVLHPRSAAEVVSILQICAEANIAIAPGSARPRAVVDLSDLARVLPMDSVSGMVEAEGGAGSAALRAGGVPLDFDGTLSHWLTSAAAPDLHSVTLATPRGLLKLDSGLAFLARAGVGIVTGATLRALPPPEQRDRRAWLLRDFASGLVALREAARAGLTDLRLLDGDAARLAHAAETQDFKQRLFDAWLTFSRFEDPARLEARFSGSEKDIAAALRRMTAIVRRLEVQADPVRRDTVPLSHHREAFLDRGTAIGEISVQVDWAQLPLRYAALRSALKQAMLANAPLPGAEGIVAAMVDRADAHGARLTVTWLYPRKLEDEAGQAAAIRAAIPASDTEQDGTLKQDVLRAIRQTLDPKAILS